ncbi:hypothetical protein PHISCL_03638 [Aspergillus sclerotialis]|uniref:Uncharacterized protein n=1 Tax=Aspergillus sclerotialis TaxID=2070753 RepID=A0A3A2ZXJ7_9EURO|nr:hypothetical protein PHISCL_03638 [Aspergillus sclerotialis]
MWGVYAPDIGDSSDYCSDTAGTLDASSGISLDNVPFPGKLEFKNADSDELAATVAYMMAPLMRLGSSVALLSELNATTTSTRKMK